MDDFIEDQHRIIATTLDSLPRERWLDHRVKAERYRAWLAFMRKDTAAADRILAWRGTCTIRIHVHPYAEVRGPFVEALPPQERYTPLALLGVEIADGEIEILHPAHGKRSVPVRDLRNGASYVLEGTWEKKEAIALKEEQ